MKDEKEYTYRSIRDERRYGFFWYSGLWHLLRPILIGLTVLVLTAGICLTVWNRLYSEYAAPADPDDSSGVLSGAVPEGREGLRPVPVCPERVFLRGQQIIPGRTAGI